MESDEPTPEGGTPDLGPCPKCIARNRARKYAHRVPLIVGRLNPCIDGSLRCGACDEWFWPVKDEQATAFLTGEGEDEY